MSKVCESCGQTIKLTHKETLSKQKLDLLTRAAEHVKSTMRNNFKKADVPGFDDNPTAYNNFQKLRYHGLITQVAVNGQRSRDHWLITRNGWAFLRGEVNLPKYVLVKNNHIESRADQQISMRDIYHGADYIQTNFEYFDDDGKPVGFRPLLPQAPPQQSSLFGQIGQRI